MIEDMVQKLEEEAGAELEHKQWCDKELKLTGEDKDKFQAEVEQKTAEKGGLESERSSNESEIKRLNTEVEELKKEISASTTERNEQKAVNEGKGSRLVLCH